MSPLVNLGTFNEPGPFTCGKVEVSGRLDDYPWVEAAVVSMDGKTRVELGEVYGFDAANRLAKREMDLNPSVFRPLAEVEEL